MRKNFCWLEAIYALSGPLKRWLEAAEVKAGGVQARDRATYGEGSPIEWPP
jgi:hypothetical protein